MNQIVSPLRTNRAAALGGESGARNAFATNRAAAYAARFPQRDLAKTKPAGSAGVQMYYDMKQCEFQMFEGDS
jgi:hypothetical protein